MLRLDVVAEETKAFEAEEQAKIGRLPADLARCCDLSAFQRCSTVEAGARRFCQAVVTVRRMRPRQVETRKPRDRLEQSSYE